MKGHRTGRRAVVALALALAASAAGAGEWTVLAPRDGFQAVRGEAWLVVEARRAPRVVVDGRVIPVPAAPAKGLYHVRLTGLRGEGSRVEVGEGPGAVRLTVSSGGDGSRGFHRTPPKACGSCHGAGGGKCRSCHRWQGAKHERLRQGSCDACHRPGAALPREVAGLCAGCHPPGKGGKHGRLRHSLAAPQDPSRPGRSLDCTSCHDPHAPVPLGRLSSEDQRTWCKGCHRR